MHRADYTPLVPMLEKLRRAARERRQVAMVYRARSKPEPLQRDVDPYALVHRWGLWYMVGYCHLREDIRSFRVDRIIELTLLDQTFNTPVKFDVREYLSSEPHTQPKIQVCLRFAPEGALLALDDRAMWDSVDEHSDGSVEVTFAVPSLEWATRIALSYGPHATVLAPAEVRRQIRDWVQTIAGWYE
jgi:predicted DNA-binding transcriptional regulator YafY